jgi:Response regulator containing a CheY-like receiver domain and a GGDEF domain
MRDEVIEILLVEDDPLDMEMTLRALRSEQVNNRILVVRDGEEALDFLFSRGAYKGAVRERQPGLILLDLNLPKVDGLQVLREIKSHPDLRAIPVVILTSSAEQRDLIESYHLGVNSYIQKPVDSLQFRQAVKALGTTGWWSTSVHRGPRSRLRRANDTTPARAPKEPAAKVEPVAAGVGQDPKTLKPRHLVGLEEI